jgi:acyl-CoA dehydrogenase
MTEPPPGAGSDPAALMSTARKVPGGWQLNGDKHFITGADGAGFAIVMAKSEGQGAPEGASMFLVEADNPGWQVGNRMRWTCWCSARGPGPAAASPTTRCGASTGS